MRTWAHIVVVATVLCGTGCHLISLPYFLLFGMESKQPAEWICLAKHHKGKKQVKVVVVAAPSGLETRPEFIRADRELMGLLIQHLEKGFKANKEKVEVIPARQVEKYKETHPHWQTEELAAIGEHFEADFVIYLEIESLSLYEKGSANQLYRGRAAISVDVIDMENLEGDPLKQHFDCEYPFNGPVPADDRNPVEFRLAFLNHVAKHLSWYFTAHPVSQEFAE